jgi:hypothetical protein
MASPGLLGLVDYTLFRVNIARIHLGHNVRDGVGVDYVSQELADIWISEGIDRVVFPSATRRPETLQCI